MKKMTTNKDLDFLEQMFLCDRLNAKCRFCNGMQIGSVIAQMFMLGNPKIWWVQGIFWTVTIVTVYYIRKHAKAVDKLEELV